jgi:uncharacterized protein (TIGR03067 family)
VDAPRSDAAKKELEKFQGTWQLVSAETDGVAAPAERVKQIRVVIDGSKHTVFFGDQEVAHQIPFELDPTTKPKSVTDSLPDGQTIKGIYEIDGDTLKSCVAAPGKDRPKEFTAKACSGLTLRVFKRVNDKSLFDGKSLDGWKACDFADPGKVLVKDGAIVMEKGATMTGVAYTRGDFPKIDYEVSFEGQRVAGGDFFCTTIFPVDDKFCSLVVGGWGGTIVGLSNVNHDNASQNETTAHKDFDNGKWYKVRLRVTKDRIITWIDADKVVDLDTTDRKLSLHGACEPCKPFGLTTWKTTGAVRSINVRPLTDAEKTPAK